MSDALHVTRLADDVRERALPLTLADHGFMRRPQTHGGEAAGAADLRVGPGHVVAACTDRSCWRHTCIRWDPPGWCCRPTALLVIRYWIDGPQPAQVRWPGTSGSVLAASSGVVEARPLVRAEKSEAPVV